MHSIPHSKSSSMNRTYTATKLRKNLHSNNSILSLNNDLTRYDDLIKKARDTINKYQNNNISNSRSKEKILNNSIQNIERKNSNPNLNYSFLAGLSSQRESRDDIRTEYSNYSNFGVENYYKNLITQLKTDSNIQNERMRSLESKNKKNELDLIDNERERGRLEEKVKNLEKRLNETKTLYDDLRRQKENLESNYEQLRYDYKNDMKKAELNSICKNKEIEEILTKENEMIKNELNKFIKENINLKLSIKSLKQEIGTKNNDIIISLKNENKRLNSQLESKKEKFLKLDNNIYLNQDVEFIWPSLGNQIINENGKCYGLKKQLGILVNGDVVPCCLDQNGDIKLGNIFENSIEEILNSSKAKRIIEGFNNRILTEELCKKCGFIKVRF